MNKFHRNIKRGDGEVQEREANEEIYNENIYLGSKIIKEAYYQCRSHQVSTCRFIRMDEKFYKVLLEDSKNYFHGIPGNVLVDLTQENFTKMNHWGAFAKTFANNIEFLDPSRQKQIIGMDRVLTQLYQNTSINLEREIFCEKGSSSLKNGILHFLKYEEEQDLKKDLLRRFILGETFSLSRLRELGIHDIKTSLNKRNGILFLKVFIDFLVLLGVKTVIIFVKGKGFPKEGVETSTIQEKNSFEMMKDLIDLTALTHLKNTLVIFSLDKLWNLEIIHNEALKSRLHLDENQKGNFPHIMATVYPLSNYRKEKR